MSKVYLSFGSNLGDRKENIEKALRLLESDQIRIIKQSTIIETKPVGGPKQSMFLNGVLEIETSLSPKKLLKHLQTIEKELGRIRTVINGPRTIDLDILLFDSLIIDNQELTIPHPRMWERDFVTIPLKEIAPDLVEGLVHARN